MGRGQPCRSDLAPLVAVACERDCLVLNYYYSGVVEGLCGDNKRVERAGLQGRGVYRKLGMPDEESAYTNKRRPLDDATFFMPSSSAASASALESTHGAFCHLHGVTAVCPPSALGRPPPCTEGIC